jgi:predicted small secreted protein
MFKNKNISKKLKLKLKNTIINKTLTYASETWILTKRDKKKTNIFERKVYRRILGLVHEDEKKNWRILTNKEIYSLVIKLTITGAIRLNRLGWFGKVLKMEENKILKKVLNMNLEETRLRGRKRNRL